MRFRVSTLLLVLIAGATARGGGLRLASIFTDHLVLQEGEPIAVWGSGSAGAEVTVRFAGQQKRAMTAVDGFWSTSLDPLPASATGAELSVRAGSNELKIHDVLVGEVWLCAGQSNMAAPLHEFDESGDEARKAEFPNIRMIRIPERPAELARKEFDAHWKICSPSAASAMSAFGYYFARKLQQDNKHIPIGIVLCAWGGSSVAAWTSPQALDQSKLRELIPYDVIGWRENCRPSKLYLGMLAAVAPYSIRGVVWYQGETEGDPEQNAYAYRLLFPAMIQDWRKLWTKPDLPFHFVQLPRLIKKPQWPVVREGQAAALALPRTAMIVTLDLGHERELHPKNKQQFAERMAALVEATTDDPQCKTLGPVIQSCEVSGDQIVVQLNAAAGLKTSDGQPPRCFEIAGANHEFQPAEAKLDGSTITVRSDRVAKPVALRYAFDGDPNVNVVDFHSLPLAPYRSDDWPVLTSELSPVELPGKADLSESQSAGAITKGSDKQWTWVGRGATVGDLETARLVRPMDSGMCQLAVANRLRQPLTEKSPTLAWSRKIDGFDPKRGMTAEVQAQLYRATAPQAGLEIQLSLVVESQLRQYQISIAPMRVYGFQDDEIRTLGFNLDNSTRRHAYRLAIREDGIAQVYFDQQLLGTLRPTIAPAETNAESKLTFGKTVPRGEITANVSSVAFDLGGAFRR